MPSIRACEEPVAGKICACGTQRQNSHVCERVGEKERQEKMMTAVASQKMTQMGMKGMGKIGRYIRKRKREKVSWIRKTGWGTSRSGANTVQ